jgi:hypothetical protein
MPQKLNIVHQGPNEKRIYELLSLNNEIGVENLVHFQIL